MKGRKSIMFSCLSAILVFCVVIQPIDSQGDLSGQDMAEDESSQDMMEHDPNILNPINQEGYGRNIPTTVNDNSGKFYTFENLIHLRYYILHYFRISVVQTLQHLMFQCNPILKRQQERKTTHHKNQLVLKQLTQHCNLEFW